LVGHCAAGWNKAPKIADAVKALIDAALVLLWQNLKLKLVLPWQNLKLKLVLPWQNLKLKLLGSLPTANRIV
jgi:hypothetical protein